MKDENENDFDFDEDAEDITNDPRIKCIESYPERHYFNLEVQAMCSASKDEYMVLDAFEIKEVYLIWDMGNMKIDTFDIGLNEDDHAEKIKVYTSDNNNENDYRLIKIKRKLQKKETKTFYLKGRHKRFIKIAIQDRIKNGRCAINKLIFRGNEENTSSPGDTIDFTKKVKIYQCSSTQGEAINVLKNNQDIFAGVRADICWIIFDLGRYEIEKFVIVFEPKCVPGIVKFKLSDVAPRYSFFNMPSTKKFKLDGIFAPPYDAKWIAIKTQKELEIEDDIYNKQGFKRYAMLEFSRYYVDELK